MSKRTEAEGRTGRRVSSFWFLPSGFFPLVSSGFPKDYQPSSLTYVHRSPRQTPAKEQLNYFLRSEVTNGQMGQDHAIGSLISPPTGCTSSIPLMPAST